MKHLIKNDKLVIIPSSDIISDNADDFQKEFINILNNIENINFVEIDMSGVDFIDSSGVGIIIGLYKESINNNYKFNIIKPNENILKIFKLLKFENFFNYN